MVQRLLRRVTGRVLKQNKVVAYGHYTFFADGN